MASDDRHLPVLAEPIPEARVIERKQVEPMPLSAPVAAATSGVLVGLATMALVKAVRNGGLGGGRRGAIRVGFLGVKPEFQATGAAAALYLRHFDIAAVTPHKRAETGWVLEDNVRMNRALGALGARPAKRFRVFERPIVA